MWKKISSLSLGFLIYLSIHTTETIAHGSKIDYNATSAVEIMAKFDNGKPMSKAQVVIYAPNNPRQPWLKGMTDENGRFVFAPDYTITGDWSVKVRAAGHGSVINIPIKSMATNQESSTDDTQAKNVENVDDNHDDTAKINNSSDNNANNSIASSTTVINSQPTPTMMQKLVMAATGVWGFVGTALFFSRQKD